ncbi:amidohydrolase family protein [Luteimonas sp. RIT-PG2_3]
MRHVHPATTTTVTVDSAQMRSPRERLTRRGHAAWLLLALAIAPALQATQDPSAVQVAFKAEEGTWMSLDVAPDGKRIVFDLLGDLYSVGIDGGAAVALVSGESFDTQPVFSPDGREIAFISDRDGSENLWVAAADGTAARALSRGDNGVLVGPAWSADGRQVVVTRFEQRNRLVGEIPGTLWAYPRTGGAGMQIPAKATTGNAGASSTAGQDKADVDRGLRGIGASASADGRHLYFAGGGDGNYEVRRRDLRTGQVLTVIHGPREGSGFFQPVPSPDGRYIAYATGWEGSTELRLRSLVDGSDRRIAYPIEPTLAAEPIPFQGLLPRYAFTPDSTSIVIAHGGKLRRVDLRNAEQQTIPFHANVALQAHRSPRPGLTDEGGAVRARLIQAPALSPDGSRIAFSAFGKLYQMTLSDGVAKRLTETPLTADAATENQPAWSPDGQWIAYTSWSRRDGGQVWRIRSDGSAAPVQITRTAGYYRKPVYAPDGASLLVLRSWMHEQLQLIVPRGYDPQRPFLQDLVRIPLADGHAGSDGILVTQLPGFTGAIDHGRPVFHPSRPLVWIHTRDGLQEIALDGSTTRTLVTLSAQDNDGEGTTVDELFPSPDGRHLLVLHNHQLYLMEMPAAGRSGEGVTLELAGSKPIASLRRLTEIGADHVGWSSDGRDIFWSVGSSFYRQPLREALSQASSTPPLSDVGLMCREDALTPYQVVATLPRAAPTRTHALVLRGARVATMRGDEIIENADIVIDGTRIAAVGKRGTVDIPAGAEIRDVSGKTITPGFVDTHAHYWGIGRGIVDYGIWEHRVALAHGITASLDPQSFTADMFVYQDLIDAGVMEGPRAYTTGPGIFDTAGASDDRKAACILRRYRDHYRTGIVKSYMVGDRAHRQHMTRAARSLDMLLVAENWGSPRYALTQAIDGFATNEHASDALDYHEDVATLYAQLGTGYSPTTLIGGAAGMAAVDYFIARENALDDAKLNRFTPRFVLNQRLRRADWAPKEDFAFERIAASAATIFRAGGNVGLGSHSELQGLGYHWEMQALSMGGLRPHEVLQIATRGSSSVLDRRKDMGTVAAGQYADLIIFDRNPLLDIHDTRAFRQLVKNGCLYNADTLEKVGPC